MLGPARDRVTAYASGLLWQPDAGVSWFEESFAPERPELFRALRSSLGGVALVAGENEFGLQGFKELIDSDVVQIVQPDCCRCSALTKARRIVGHAVGRDMRFAPHTWSDAVPLVANMHMVAASPSGLTVEVERTGNPSIDDLLPDQPRIAEGHAVIPDRAGLGLRLNPEVIARYFVPRGERTPPGNCSGMVFR